MKEYWKVKKLGEVCEVINGFAFKSTLFKDDGEPILRISNIQNGIITLENVVYFEKKDYKVKLDKYKVYPNDILIALSGATTGKVGVNRTNLELYLNQRVALCREKEFHLRGYLYYFLQTKTKELLSLAGGVAQPNLSTEQIKNLDIYSPSLDEQFRIVEELDLLSNIIEKKHKQLSELDNLAQSIFYDMFGDPNNSIYEVVRLADLAKNKMSYGSGASAIQYNGKIRYIRITDIKEDGTLSDEKMSPNVVDDKYMLCEGDILFARSGATVGKTYLYSNKDGMGIYAGYLIRFVANTNIVIPKYIYYYTRTTYYKAFIAASAQTVAQPNINAQQYGNLKVCVPPLSLQQLFAQKIEAIEQQKALVKQSIAETKELFNSRMDYYFN